MESWRGLSRRAMGRLAAAWRTGPSPGDPTAHDNGDKQANHTGRTAAGPAPRPDRAGPSQAGPSQAGNGSAEEDRIARGTGVAEQVARGKAVQELNRVSEPAAGRSAAGERREAVPEQSRVPGWLQTAAAWSWRLLLVAIVIYLITRMLGVLYIVVVPCIAALLLTALLQPLTSRLRRAGLPALAATWVTLLVGAIVFGGLVLLVANRVSADYPTVLAEAKHTTAQVQSWLAGPPLHIKNSNVQKFLNNIPNYLSKHKSLVEGTLVTGGKIATEFFGGLVLMLFVTFFLIKDGERIWTWLLGAMRTATVPRM